MRKRKLLRLEVWGSVYYGAVLDMFGSTGCSIRRGDNDGTIRYSGSMQCEDVILNASEYYGLRGFPITMLSSNAWRRCLYFTDSYTINVLSFIPEEQAVVSNVQSRMWTTTACDMPILNVPRWRAVFHCLWVYAPYSPYWAMTLINFRTLKLCLRMNILVLWGI